MQPELVSGLKVGNVGYGQCFAGAGNADLNFWASEIESSRLCRRQIAGKEQRYEGAGEPKASVKLSHHSILDGLKGGLGCCVRMKPRS